MPHLRELVKLHSEKPFAIIGVNTGDSPEVFRQGVEDHGVSWITAYQGRKRPIADLFRVSAYPTYYLLDVDGKIAAKGHSSKTIEKELDKLLAEMEKKERD